MLRLDRKKLDPANVNLRNKEGLDNTNQLGLKGEARKRSKIQELYYELYQKWGLGARTSYLHAHRREKWFLALCASPRSVQGLSVNPHLGIKRERGRKAKGVS